MNEYRTFSNWFKTYKFFIGNVLQFELNSLFIFLIKWGPKYVKFYAIISRTIFLISFSVILLLMYKILQVLYVDFYYTTLLNFIISSKKVLSRILGS